MEAGLSPGWRRTAKRWCSSSCKSSPAAAATMVNSAVDRIPHGWGKHRHGLALTRWWLWFKVRANGPRVAPFTNSSPFPCFLSLAHTHFLSLTHTLSLTPYVSFSLAHSRAQLQALHQLKVVCKAADILYMQGLTLGKAPGGRLSAAVHNM